MARRADHRPLARASGTRHREAGGKLEAARRAGEPGMRDQPPPAPCPPDHDEDGLALDSARLAPIFKACLYRSDAPCAMTSRTGRRDIPACPDSHRSKVARQAAPPGSLWTRSCTRHPSARRVVSPPDLRRGGKRRVLTPRACGCRARPPCPASFRTRCARPQRSSWWRGPRRRRARNRRCGRSSPHGKHRHRARTGA